MSALEKAAERKLYYEKLITEIDLRSDIIAILLRLQLIRRAFFFANQFSRALFDLFVLAYALHSKVLLGGSVRLRLLLVFQPSSSF